MHFGPLSLDVAAGHILGHNVVDETGRRVLRKGVPLEPKDIEILRALGHCEVWVAQLERGDVLEDAAAARVTTALLGSQPAEDLGVERSGPRTGRLNLRALMRGLLRVDAEQVHSVNRFDGVTFATLAPLSVVDAGRIVATVKILPYALPVATLEAVDEAIGPLDCALRLEAIPRRRCGLIVSGHPGGRERTSSGFETALRVRLEALGSTLDQVVFVASSLPTSGAVSGDGSLISDLARAIATMSKEVDVVLLAGETAIQDRHDMAPVALEKAGGVVTCFGAPVDPGNLLLLGHLGETPVLGVPGCARSPKRNIVDLILPRILVGDRLSAADIDELGVGGLLEDVPERRLPRSRI